MRSPVFPPAFNANAAPRQREDAAEMVADLRFRRNVERVCSLGTRAVSELLSEIGAERAIQHLVDRKVERYADLDPDLVQALGGNRFAKPPLRLVRPDDEGPAP